MIYMFILLVLIVTTGISVLTAVYYKRKYDLTARIVGRARRNIKEVVQGSGKLPDNVFETQHHLSCS